MAGILPIKKKGSPSAISDLKEYSILNPNKFADDTDFTETKVKTLCEQDGMDFALSKHLYDGYSFA